MGGESICCHHDGSSFEDQREQRHWASSRQSGPWPLKRKRTPLHRRLQEILALFKSLPGDVAVKIHAPATNGKPEFLVGSNAAKVLFVGSAFKSFVLCEALTRPTWEGPSPRSN
jgi:hypothetical protein